MCCDEIFVFCMWRNFEKYGSWDRNKRISRVGLCMLPWLYRQDLGGGVLGRGVWGCVAALWARYLWFLCLSFPPWVGGSPFTYIMGSPYELPNYNVQDDDEEGLLNDVDTLCALKVSLVVRLLHSMVQWDIHSLVLDWVHRPCHSRGLVHWNILFFILRFLVKRRSFLSGTTSA